MRFRYRLRTIPRFIARLSKQIVLRASPVTKADFPELNWRVCDVEGEKSNSASSADVSRETQLGFYDLQIPCATTNARHDRKLSLVLDLDQTLVHAVKVVELFSDVMAGQLHSVAESFIGSNFLDCDNPNLIQSFTIRIEFKGSSLDAPNERRQLLCTRLDGEMYLIKLRPGLREFLHALAAKYELHIYTKANRNYLNFLLYELDPVGKLFTSAVARDDSPDLDTDLKILDRVCCRNMKEVVVFDDRVDVWNETPNNVVRAQPYNYLQHRRTAVIKGLEELIAASRSPTHTSTATVTDYDGHLYAMKDVLETIFDQYVAAGEKIPVPEIIKKVRQEVLKGVKLQFTGFTEALSHMKEAEEFGATCSAIDDSSDDTILVAAKHTKRVYDLSKSKSSGASIVHWSWMEHVRSTWSQPSLSVFDLHRFRVDSTGVYAPIDDWEVSWIASTAEHKNGSDRMTHASSKRQKRASQDS